jgi:Reverse transcriptase (RNA-dependent DNA polymerase)
MSNLVITFINVNSFNVSGIGAGSLKTLVKVEGVTGGGADIICMSDTRLGKSASYVERLFRLSQNGQYKLVHNSTKDSRGVGIAIKEGRGVEIIDVWKDEEDENWMILEVKIGNNEMLIGVIYGPNSNNVRFYRNLYNWLSSQNKEFIIGGDFNTILDRRNNNFNLDREGEGNIPNTANSEEINRWIDEGLCIDPYRLLYPDEKESSYIPFREDREVVRNRLDFCLVTHDLAAEISDVRYEDRLSKDFDHKEVKVTVGKKRSSVRSERIYNSTLREEYVEIVGLLGYFETINTHLRFPKQEINDLIYEIERLIREIELLKILEREYIGHPQQRGRIEERRRDLGPLMVRLARHTNTIEEEFTCDYRNLYEVVIMAIKGRLLAKQTRDRREKNKIKRDILDRRETIRILNGKDSNEYRRINIELEEIMTRELRDRAGKFKEFFDQNNERPTRMFYRLGKCKEGNDSTGRIKDAQGNGFRNEEDRKQYIGNFYGNLYKKKLDRLIEIENFLDMDKDRERDNKLSEEEKQTLEGEITLEELKEALDSSNMESASGWDGVSYMMIKKYWNLLGPLLVRAANESMTEGRLSNTFRLGVIKLIPKKKESDRIEDWRPITLLSCGYKVISGVVAKRLERYLWKLLGRAQKGFLKHKNIHMCTMNIIENITQSWENREGMGTICIDFSKAFDCVEHEFIGKVMEYFNYGELMQRMVRTLLTDREGRVIMENGYSNVFKIERGTPQGDRSSPYIFILCIEILLLRLEDEGAEIEMKLEFNENIRNRENMASSIAEAYADDLTIMIKWSVRNVIRIIEIIRSFGLVSGLDINVNKTQIMITGIEMHNREKEQIEEQLEGLKLVDKISILGVEIEGRRGHIESIKNWDKVENKILNMIRYWRQFNLGIGGRIMVGKTYLLSQVTYLLGILEIDDYRANRINTMIMEFIIGQDKAIARERWYWSVEQGGYGMIDIKHLNLCIKSAWIGKWNKQRRMKDYVKERIMSGNYDKVHRININQLEGLGLYMSRRIISEWNNYKEKFYRTERNVLEAHIFMNIGLINVNETVERKVFGLGRRELVTEAMGNIRVKDIIGREMELPDKVGIERKLGFQLNFAEFFRIRNILYSLKEMIGDEGMARKLEVLLVGKQVGRGGYMRKLLQDKTWNRRVENHPYATTLRRGEAVGIEIIATWVGSWNYNRLEASFRNFIFKLVQGQLILNNVISRIDATVRKYCTFCLITREDREEDMSEETIEHLMWSCRTTQGIINRVRNRMREETLTRDGILHR